MIQENTDASGIPAQTALEQELFKAKMERDAFKAQHELQVKKNEELQSSLAAMQLSQEYKALLLANALELIRLQQAELYGKSSEKMKFYEAYYSRLFDEPEFSDLVDKVNLETEEVNDEHDEQEEPKKQRKAHKKQDLTTLPAHTPCICVDHTTEIEAPIDAHTGKKMVQVGTREELKIGRQNRTVVYVHIFPVFAPKEDYEADREYDETNVVVAYPAQQRVLKGAMISNEIFADIVSRKYLDHMPLHRLEAHFKRMGLSISRQNMKNWIFAAAPRCGPLIALLRKYLLSCDVINMDETPHRVLTIEGSPSETEHYEIIQVGTCDEYRVVMYSFNVKKNSEVFASLLRDFTGALMVDGHKSYTVAVQNEAYNLNCIKLACWAHARRYLVDLLKTNSKSKSKSVIARISKLYNIESDLRGMVLRKEIGRQEFVDRRVHQTKPVFQDIKKWLDEAKERAVQGSLLAKAVNYCLTRWDELISYPYIFHATPDNNLAELYTRPFSIGSNNWLFSDTGGGAEISSVMFTLAQNAKLSGINETDYLWAVLDRIPHCCSEQDWQALLPWNIDLSDIAAKKALLASAVADPHRTEPYIIRGGRY